MKYFYLVFSTVLAAVLLNSCASNKELQEGSPAQFDQSYFTSTSNSLQLFIPVKAIQANRISLDSVYFRGMKSALQQDPENTGVYTAQFNTGNKELIMSSDPAEEYANKVPQMPVKVPFELKSDEALVVFKENNKKKYYRITGIKERSKE
ncbi:hypothetical protein [Gillisia limnaea]|uniref:Membrane or secreted protein n=1 Tax=Gillisia limnaea (strain DSM 15749 / LMG 21470 / R-8282) TaxID=865937 RepID=H2BUD9_GILLR|nr:hypothetical protein [Gillisia limnaea]EHQ02773.1 membrane or secreted protein [Gillisia limnaea DSM 15749]